MESDFDCVLHKYCFAEKLYYPDYNTLRERLSDLTDDKKLVLLDYNNPDFMDSMILLQQSGQRIVLMIQDCFSVKHWAGILPLLKSIGSNFAISTVADNGLVEWHD